MCVTNQTPIPSRTIPSPCVSVCQLDPETGWCRGCWRTMIEIASWARLVDDERRTIIQELHERRASRGSMDRRRPTRRRASQRQGGER
ncbi:MAG: DUF1289 domain-containing protein [Rhodospirillaceae bacterium]|nr:DUF1289 domain-containing protein [Rhodospirillaceae bacterium]MBT6136696.1 DUF1289 domain-containing protein [Rhodospirillaceae bacterium]